MIVHEKRSSRRLFIKPGIQERGTECGERGECSLGFRGISQKIPGNVRRDSEECSKRFRGIFEKIPGNVRRDSGECSKRFWGIFEKIPGNVSKDSGECWQRFSKMLKKIERFIMQLNKNRIKECIPKYDKKNVRKSFSKHHM